MKAPAIIKEARLRAGLTQAELAKRLRTTQSVVARWEAGERSPSLETVEKVARACDLDVSIFLVTHDDHDFGQAQQMRRLQAGQRIEYLTDAARKLDSLPRPAQPVPDRG